jgi:protein-L-isoaspartate(D-aspartate) O-methyltransferase
MMEHDRRPSKPAVESELAAVRRAYAKQIVFAADVADPRIEAALANVRRENFLEPGPWPIMQPMRGYRMTPDDNPVYLYQDVLVGIVPEKGLNNGQPSFLIFLISLGRPVEGERVVHIGAGQGYYTAVIAELVGDTVESPRSSMSANLRLARRQTFPRLLMSVFLRATGPRCR